MRFWRAGRSFPIALLKDDDLRRRERGAKNSAAGALGGVLGPVPCRLRLRAARCMNHAAVYLATAHVVRDPLRAPAESLLSARALHRFRDRTLRKDPAKVRLVLDRPLKVRLDVDAVGGFLRGRLDGR